MPFYKRMWFIVLMLIVFAPMGIILLWNFGKQQKNTKLVLSVIFGIFFIIVLSTNGCNHNNNTTSARATAPHETANVSLQATQRELKTATLTVEPTIERTEEPTLGPTVELTPSPAPMPQTYKISIVVSKGKLVSNDHVGKSWSTGAKIADVSISFGKTKSLTLRNSDTFTIVCSATENDKSPDEGDDYFDVAVSDLKDGKNVFTREVIVSEDRGRYSGNEAIWHFTVTITKTVAK